VTYQIDPAANMLEVTVTGTINQAERLAAMDPTLPELKQLVSFMQRRAAEIGRIPCPSTSASLPLAMRRWRGLQCRNEFRNSDGGSE